MKYIILLITCFIALNNENEVILKKKNTINIDNNEAILLHPIKVLSMNKFYIWIDNNSIKFIDKKGRVVKELNNKGRGPAEYQGIEDALISENFLFIYDNRSKKILKFEIKNNSLEYLEEIRFNVPNNRNFTVSNTNAFFLLGHSMNPEASSVISYNFEGEKLSEYGNIPVTAALSRSLAGGGITYYNNAIYYSYLGDPTLYKIDLQNDNISQYLNIPYYYTNPDKTKIKKIEGEMTELIYYAYEVSRVKDVFNHKDYIIQVVEDGGARMKKGLSYYLEIWQNDKKVGSGISIKSGQVFSDQEYIYSVVSKNDSDIVIHKYELE